MLGWLKNSEDDDESLRSFIDDEEAPPTPSSTSWQAEFSKDSLENLESDDHISSSKYTDDVSEDIAIENQTTRDNVLSNHPEKGSRKQKKSVAKSLDNDVERRDMITTENRSQTEAYWNVQETTEYSNDQ